MVTRFHNISTDDNLSENSNILVPSQRAVRNFIASKAIQLKYLQSTMPADYSTGDNWLNSENKMLYTAISSSSWGTGKAIQIDQFFTFNDLLYYYDGTNIVAYSTHSITETHNDNKLKFWVGTTDEYNALGTYDPNTIYIKSDDTPATSAVLATQTEFDNGSSTTAATPYQIKQELGNYLPKSGGNLNASAVLRLTNANNEVSALAFNTNGYLTISTGLNVNNDLTTNSLVVRSCNLYKVSTGGTSVVWTDTYASSSSYGAVKVDGTTITASNGVISSNVANVPAATSTTLGGVMLDYNSATNTLNIKTS